MWLIHVEKWPKEAAKLRTAEVCGVSKTTVEKAGARKESGFDPLLRLVLHSNKSMIADAVRGVLSEKEIADTKEVVAPALIWGVGMPDHSSSE